ncbi:MAG: iron complex transport system permease protein [Cryomorphaceae bacterium]|jgi:iron complex transport system permease protein
MSGQLKTPNLTYTRRYIVIVVLLLLLPISFLIALSFGAVSVPFTYVLGSLINSDSVSRVDLIVNQIRLPRALLAVFVGALLGICGATTQGLFRNPLADPSLIGVTAGASAGAALTIFFASSFAGLQGLSGLGLISLGAFIGGALAVIFVYSLATSPSGTSVATMLLAGIAITAIAGGLTSLIEYFANNEMLRRISLWRMGGLDGASYQRVVIATIASAISLTLLPRFSTALNALLLGESEARHLGISVQRIKIQIIILVAFGVATSVALAGTIAFVGLVIPHIIRLLIGPDHRYLLPMSAIGGAVLLLLSDTLARTLFAPIELPVGLVTAFLGAPFFISLLRQRHSFGMQ